MTLNACKDVKKLNYLHIVSRSGKASYKAKHADCTKQQVPFQVFIPEKWKLMFTKKPEHECA